MFWGSRRTLIDLCNLRYISSSYLFKTSTVRKLSEYPSSCHDEVLWSRDCCIWFGKEGLDKEAVMKEREELNKLMKKQLVQLAASAQVHVTYCVDGKSHQVSNSMMWRQYMTNFTSWIFCSVKRLVHLLLLQKTCLGQILIQILLKGTATARRLLNSISMKASLKIQSDVLCLLIRCMSSIPLYNNIKRQSTQPWDIHIRRALEDVKGNSKGIRPSDGQVH